MNGDTLIIREAADSDLDDVLFVEREAFGEDEEAELVRDLLGDPTAHPLMSLLAYEDDAPVGHVLFTSVRLTNTDDTPTCSILAPLAVVPDAQKQGVGGALVRKGLELLTESGVELVFVLGHPDYYPRHGFQPAGVLGLTAPYPILEKDAGAWMVQELTPGVLGTVSGTVMAADEVMKPEYWVE